MHACTELCSTNASKRQNQTWAELNWIGMNWSIYYWTVLAFKLINCYHICNRFVWAYVTYLLWWRLAPADAFRSLFMLLSILAINEFLTLLSFHPNKNNHNSNVSRFIVISLNIVHDFFDYILNKCINYGITTVSQLCLCMGEDLCDFI